MTPNLALLHYLILVASVTLAQQQLANKNPFDSGDWIPMRQPCPTCHGQQQQLIEDNIPQKTSRVLNTATFPRNSFPQTIKSNYPNLEKHSHHLPASGIVKQAQLQLVNVPPLQNLPQNLPQNSPPPQIIQIPIPSNPVPEHLTPQFLPHLEKANFNPQPIFAPTAQGFLAPQIRQQPRPQPQFIQPQFAYVQPNLIQPQDDFHLLQQILNNQNPQFVQSLFNVNQTQQFTIPVTQKLLPSSTPSPTSTTVAVKPTTEKINYVTSTSAPKQQEPSKEEVQLLYVPLETLRQRGPSKVTKQETVVDKSYQPTITSLYQLDYKKQNQLQTIENDFIQQAIEAQQLQNQLKQATVQSTSASIQQPTVTTPIPSIKQKAKLKPHQPPLAVFMGNADAGKNEDIKVADVLTALSTARTIAVLDQVTSQMPQVFVGPSEMKAPNGYAKFELPYLSNLDSNRIQRKVEQLPFFVAPLSYRTPDGYSKIPFPPPHVGSVIIRDMKDIYEKPEDPILFTGNFKEKFNSNFPQNQFNPNFGQQQQQQQQQNKFVTPSQIPFVETVQQTPSSTAHTPTQQEYLNNYYSELASRTPSPGALDNYYFKSTTRTPTRGSVQYTTPKSTTHTFEGSSTSASLPDYTILEQFPVKTDTTTQNIIRFKQNQNGYDQLNLEKYRTQPININDEIQGIRLRNQEKLISTYVPSQSQGLVASQEVPLQNEQSYKSTTPIPYQPANTSPNVYNQYKFISSTTEKPLKTQYSPLLPTIPTDPTKTSPEYYPQPASVVPLPPNTQFNQIYNQPYAQIPQQYSEVSQKPILIGNQQIKSTTSTTESSQPVLINQEILPAVDNSQTNNYRNQYLDQQVTLQEVNNEGNKQYSLPAELPPINPNLPNLINSLQVGQPNQIPLDSSPESSSQEPTTHEPSSSSTRRPVTRGRQRTYNRPVTVTSTAATPTASRSRTTQQRRRRPVYNGRPRPEYEKYLTETNKQPVSSTTTAAPIEIKTTLAPETEITTRNVVRGRYSYQQEQSTEPPRQTNLQQTRSRFRTRGRQPQRQSTTTSTTTPEPLPNTISSTQLYANGHQNNMPLTERSSNIPVYSSTESGVIFQQPKLEGGFQVSPSFATNIEENQYVSEQRPIYRPEDNLPQSEYVNIKPTLQETALQINEQIISERPNYSTAKSVPKRPIYQASQEENLAQSEYINAKQISAENFPNDQINSEPNYSTLKSSPILTVTPDSNREVSYHTTTKPNYDYPSSTNYPQQNIPSNIEPEIISHSIGDKSEFVRFNSGTQQTTILQNPTESSRRTNGINRSRAKSRTRARTYTTSTEAVTQKKEEPEEFYGFFRTPLYQQAPINNYQQKTVSPTSPRYLNDFTVTEKPAYYSQTERPQYYPQTERSSTETAETIYIDQYGNTSPASVFPSYTENTEAPPPRQIQDEIRPVYKQAYEELPQPATEVSIEETTKAQYSANKSNRGRPQYTTDSSAKTNGVYTVRPAKRPDGTYKITKIRGRIRKPTTSTTTTEEAVDYEDGAVSSSIAQEQTTKYHQTPLVAVRQYKTHANRGKVHFRLPNAERNSDEELEEPNYPASFLQSQETYTKQPEFKITVTPIETDYSDQIPYQSINRPKYVYKNPEDGRSESQWRNKYTSTYFRKYNSSNAIPSEEKGTKKLNSAEKNITTSAPEDDPTIPITTTEGKSIFEQIFEEMAKFGADDSATTQQLATTTEESVGEIKVTKGKRRGFWKRVRVRPIDGLEVAESQNIGTANLISDSVRKTYPRPTIEQYVITFEPNNETSTESMPTEYYYPQTESIRKETENIPEIIANEDIENNTKNDTSTLIDMISTFFSELNTNNSSENITNNETESVIDFTIEPETKDSVTEITTEKLIDQDVEVTTFTNVPIPTTVKHKNLDISTENQINETKIISDKIKMYTERLEALEQNKKNDSNDLKTGVFSDPFILGTSTSTEISHETEICYRGRCIKSNSTDMSFVPSS